MKTAPMDKANQILAAVYADHLINAFDMPTLYQRVQANGWAVSYAVLSEFVEAILMSMEDDLHTQLRAESLPSVYYADVIDPHTVLICYAEYENNSYVPYQFPSASE